VNLVYKVFMKLLSKINKATDWPDDVIKK